MDGYVSLEQDVESAKYVPRSSVLESYGRSFFSILRKLQTNFHNGATIYTSTSSEECSFPPYLQQHLLSLCGWYLVCLYCFVLAQFCFGFDFFCICCCFFYLSHSDWGEFKLQSILIFIFLIAKRMEHAISWFLCISSFESNLLNPKFVLKMCCVVASLCAFCS